MTLLSTSSHVSSSPGPDLPNVDKDGEVVLQVLPQQGGEETLAALLPVISISILDAGRPNQWLKGFKQFGCG